MPIGCVGTFSSYLPDNLIILIFGNDFNQILFKYDPYLDKSYLPSSLRILKFGASFNQK